MMPGTQLHYFRFLWSKDGLVDTDIENKLVVTSGEGEGRGNTEVGEWEVQTIGCKIGYKDTIWGM